MEVTSKSVREQVLKKITESDMILKDMKDNKITFSRAKLAQQLERNKNMNRAFDRIKKSDIAKNQAVEKVWKVEGSKDRLITMNGQIVFK